MRIFVAFAFRERDRWIRERVIPLVEAFGAEVLTGESLGGERITAGVTELINSADGLLAFITARSAAVRAAVTHRWVTDELATAVANGRTKVLEIREVGVTDQGGIAGDRQHLSYDPAEEATCLVEIARVLGTWSRGLTMRVLLLPEEAVQRISPHLNRRDFSCTYALSERGEVTAEHPAKLLRRPGGLQLTARGIPPSALISVRIQAAGEVYESAFVDADALTVTLQKE